MTNVLSKDVLLRVLLLIFLTISLNPDYTNPIIWWTIVFLIVFYLVIRIIKERKFVFSTYLLWLVLLTFWCSLSLIWALNKNLSFDYLKNIYVNMIICLLLYNNINSENDIISILKLIIVASAATSLYLLLNMDFRVIGRVPIGRLTSGDNWNSNTIGVMTSIAAISSLAILKRGVAKKQFLIYIITFSFFVIMSLLTGSRRTVITLLLGIGIFIFFSSKRKLITSIIIIIFFILSTIAIFNIPWLYNILGVRMGGLFAIITGKGDIDSSSILRMNMITSGLNWFYDRPLLGYGINNYRDLLYSLTNRFTYAHNNYIELLVDIGIIGTSIYYSIFVIAYKKLLRKNQNNILRLYFLSIILIILINDIGMISIINMLTQLIICITLSFTKIQNLKKIKEEIF